MVICIIATGMSCPIIMVMLIAFPQTLTALANWRAIANARHF